MNGDQLHTGILRSERQFGGIKAVFIPSQAHFQCHRNLDRTHGRFDQPQRMPEHIWKDQDPATFAFNPPIGTGPYTFTSAASNRAIWDRNDNWWGAKTGFQDLPAPQRVIFLESGGEESRAQLIASNQLDASQNVTIGTFEAIKAQNPNVIAWYADYPYSAADPCRECPGSSPAL